MFMKLNVQSDITMNDLITKALDIKGRCKDIILRGEFTGRGSNKKPTMVPNPGMSGATVTNDGEFGLLNFLAPVTEDANTAISLPVTAKMSGWAFYQLCSVRLKVPYSYMKACIDSDHADVQALFEKNMNTLLSHSKNGARIRLFKPDDEALTVRGIVTEGYTVFDSDQVLQAVHNVLGDNFNIKGYSLNQEGLHLRVVTPEPLKINDEDLYPGFIITSGDVGNRSLQMTFFLWKQVCTNGLVMERLTGRVLHKRHFGVYNPQDFEDALITALEAFPVFCENAKTLVEETRRKELTPEMLEDRLKAFSKEIQISQEEQAKITNLIVGNYGMTLWGFINALTEFAQERRFDLDDRMMIETYAGELMLSKAA